MRAQEFITEDQNKSLADDVAAALPATFSIPALQNQDPYLQYRFGVALAQTKGRLGTEQPGEGLEHPMEPRSAWGENMVVVSYDPNIDDWLDAALKEVGLSSSDKKIISSRTSDEPKTIQHVSPIKGFKGYPR